MWKVFQSIMNTGLPDKGLSIDSHAMGVASLHNKSIASRVQASYSAPRGLFPPHFKQIVQEISQTMEILIFLIHKAI